MLRRIVSLIALSSCLLTLASAAAAAPLPAPAAPTRRVPLAAHPLACLPQETPPGSEASAPHTLASTTVITDTAAPIAISLQSSSVAGQVDPNVAVTITVRSPGGAVKYQDTTESSGSGHYTGYSDYTTCSQLEPGDAVTVTTGSGQSFRMTVAPIDAVIDVTTDTILGTTAANRRVETTVYQAALACTPDETRRATTANGAGGFVVPYGGALNINRSAYADVKVYDGDSFTYATLNAPHISLGPNNSVHATLAPNAVYTFTHTAATLGGPADSTIETLTGITDPWGDFAFFPAHTPQPSDRLTVTDGTQTVTLTVAPFRLTQVDEAGNQVSGQTAPNRRLHARFDSGNRPDCARAGDCQVVQTGATGLFTASTGIGLFPGDALSFTLFDAQGNSQQLNRRVTALAFNPATSSTSGYWTATEDTLTARLQDGNGTVKETRTVSVNPNGGSFATSFTQPSAPGDLIAVGNGSITETVTAVSLTAYPQGGAVQQVTGAGPANAALRLSVGFLGAACQVTTADGAGHYAASFNANTLRAGTEVTVQHFNAAGNANETRGYVPQINLFIDRNQVQGYVERPRESVSITVQDAGNAVLATATRTSSTAGAYHALLLDTNGQPVNLKPGDKVTVTSDSGMTTALTVPELTIMQDVAQNRVYGQTLPQAEIAIQLNVGFDFVAYDIVTTDASGQYEVSYTARQTFQCQPVAAGPCTIATGQLTTPAGHRVSRSTPAPPDEQPDLYENDDTAQTAQPYGGPQAHTFHAPLDVDWVSLTVTAEQLARTFTIATTQPGVLADTLLTLYDSDGTTVLAAAGEFGGERTAALRHRFAAAGTYYIRIEPAAATHTQACGATYTLVIVNASDIFLPRLLRDD